MAKMAELTKEVHAPGATSRPLPKKELDRLNRLPQHSRHLKPKDGENNLNLLKENDLPERMRRRGTASTTFKKINPVDIDWEKKLEKIIKKKIKSCIREKGPMDSIDVVIELIFTKKIMVYPNS